MLVCSILRQCEYSRQRGRRPLCTLPAGQGRCPWTPAGLRPAPARELRSLDPVLLRAGRGRLAVWRCNAAQAGMCSRTARRFRRDRALRALIPAACPRDLQSKSRRRGKSSMEEKEWEDQDDRASGRVSLYPSDFLMSFRAIPCLRRPLWGAGARAALHRAGPARRLRLASRVLQPAGYRLPETLWDNGSANPQAIRPGREAKRDSKGGHPLWRGAGAEPLLSRAAGGIFASPGSGAAPRSGWARGICSVPGVAGGWGWFSLRRCSYFRRRRF